TVDPRATETQPAPGVPTQTNTPTSTATATNTATATATQPPPFVTCEYREVGGIVIVEAEHFAGSAGGSGHAWHTEIVPANYAGSSAMRALPADGVNRSEEHTSELQSRENLVCRLLLEKKKTTRQHE